MSKIRKPVIDAVEEALTGAKVARTVAQDAKPLRGVLSPVTAKPSRIVSNPQDVTSRLNQSSQSIYRDGGDRIYNGNMDYVARERFNIPELNKISSGGSDRDVYDLGNGYVLKVAKTARGLAQNNSADWYLANAGILPEATEIGQNYIVTKKMLPPDANTKKLVNGLKQFSYNDWRNHSNKLQQYLEDNNLEDILSYDVMSGDISSIRNWGTTQDGKPIHLDEGTFNNSLLDQYRGTKNMDNADFRTVYAKSKQAKKKYGDKDKATMYGVGLLAPIFYNSEK